MRVHLRTWLRVSATLEQRLERRTALKGHLLRNALRGWSEKDQREVSGCNTAGTGSDGLKALCTTGRHRGISVAVSTQYAKCSRDMCDIYLKEYGMLLNSGVGSGSVWYDRSVVSR